jgi:hypothetical protein
MCLTDRAYWLQCLRVHLPLLNTVLPRDAKQNYSSQQQTTTAAGLAPTHTRTGRSTCEETPPLCAQFGGCTRLCKVGQLSSRTGYIFRKPHLKSNISFNAGFEVLTVVVMKNSIFWDITPCSPLRVNRRFGGTHRLHLQGRRISWARNQCEMSVDIQPTTRPYIF